MSVQIIYEPEDYFLGVLKMNKKITVIKGDGIGPEIVTQAQVVLDKVCEKFGHSFEYTDILMGG